MARGQLGQELQDLLAGQCLDLASGSHLKATGEHRSGDLSISPESGGKRS